eukprot:TRINITY_DN93102_c0_g1_i1.p1 TRINITY_DN93102_c0_g1~~TRINITY_DN93102_c0_g1_i1.p1  ORF type:complete len:488 (+),score=80.94 TRINITY_DN93102_c0_g1_i1:117-1580(+)
MARRRAADKTWCSPRQMIEAGLVSILIAAVLFAALEGPASALPEGTPGDEIAGEAGGSMPVPPVRAEVKASPQGAREAAKAAVLEKAPEEAIDAPKPEAPEAVSNADEDPGSFAFVPPLPLREFDRPLKIAFVVFVTDVGSAEYKDAFAVLAYSIKLAARRTRNTIELLALCPDRFKEESAAFLRSVGFLNVLKRPMPINPSQVKGRSAREHYMKVQGSGKDNEFLMAEELVKYWGLALTSYDRTLVLDADMIIFDPMDELMRLDEPFIATYDHGLDVPGSNVPPIQGGFLLFRPSMNDFKNLAVMAMNGEWGGDGWEKSRVGYCYGGVGPVGQLPYYFNKDSVDAFKHYQRQNDKKNKERDQMTMHDNLPQGVNAPRVHKQVRMRAVERHIYDVLVNDRNMKDLKSLMESTGQREHDILAGVKSFHYTGSCVKPWKCPNRAQGGWLCQGMINRWWDLRNEAAGAVGMPAFSRSEGCRNGYKPFTQA